MVSAYLGYVATWSSWRQARVDRITWLRWHFLTPPGIQLLSDLSRITNEYETNMRWLRDGAVIRRLRANRRKWLKLEWWNAFKGDGRQGRNGYMWHLLLQSLARINVNKTTWSELWLSRAYHANEQRQNAQHTPIRGLFSRDLHKHFSTLCKFRIVSSSK